MHAHLGEHAGALEGLGYQLSDRTLVINDQYVWILNHDAIV